MFPQPVVAGGESWSTDRLAPSERRAVWREVIARAYARFEVSGATRSLRAHLHSRNVAGMSLVACTAAASRGERSRRTIGADRERRFGVQVLLAGAERLTCGDADLLLSAGSVVVWDSAMPSAFDVPESLIKATIVFPESLLRERLPRNVPLRSTLIDGSQNVGAVLRAHVTTLVEHLDSFDANDAGLRNMTLDLLAAAMLRQSSRAAAGEFARGPDRKLEQIQAYMLEHLSDCELVPATIARANGISLRYLHVLFHASGTTVAAWLKEQRLLRSRDALLADAAGAQTLSEIAFRRGFRDPANFSRDFKRRFGCSPRNFRETPRAPAGDASDR